jgi:dihydrofolate reductase
VRRDRRQEAAGDHTEWPEVKTAVNTFSRARLQESARRGLSRFPAHFGHQPAAAVVSRSDTERADCPETRIGRGDLVTQIADVMREPGKNMIARGGAAFAQSLTRLRLVDEYRLVLQPVALGHELPLFKVLTAPLHRTRRHTDL